MKKHNLTIAAAIFTVLAAAGALVANSTWYLDAWGKWFEAYAWLFSTVPALIASVLGYLKARTAADEATRAREEATRREEVANQAISIILTCGEESLTLPATLRRRDVARAELMGFIGTFYGAGRFNFPNMATLLSSGQLAAVQNGEKDELRIELPNSKEIQKFSDFINDVPQPKPAPRPAPPKPVTIEDIKNAVIEVIETDHCKKCHQPK